MSDTVAFWVKLGEYANFFFLKGNNKIVCPFLWVVPPYNGSWRKAREEAAELLLQTSRQHCAVITLKQNTALSRDFERGFVHVSVWSGFTCTKARVWQSRLIKKMSVCSQTELCIDLLDEDQSKNKHVVGDVLEKKKKRSTEQTNSSLRLGNIHPCPLDHCECVSASPPPDTLPVLSDTKCVPELWRLITPGRLVRAMPALNTNEPIRIWCSLLQRKIGDEPLNMWQVKFLKLTNRNAQ